MTSGAATDALERCSLMRVVDPDHATAIGALFSAERYEFGDLIVSKGDDADAYYVLTKGRARVIDRAADGSEQVLARLLPGDEFGESALLDGTARSATVRASTQVELLRLGRTEFLALLERYPQLRLSLSLLSRWRTLQSFFVQHSELARLPAAALKALMEALETCQVARGETIISEGDAAGSMYIVESGRAQASCLDKSANHPGDEQNPVHLAVYRAGDYFGERAMLTGQPRAATVVAVDDCQLLQLSLSAAAQLCRRYPEFDRQLQQRVAQYEYRSHARIPLDFAEELLPATVDSVDPAQTAIEAEAAPPPKRAHAAPSSRWRKFPYVAQIDQMDCAAACLAMVCRHYGAKPRLSRVRELCHTGLDGASLMDLCAAANELGLAARALKVSPENLASMPLPAICHWQGKHWVVLYAISAKHAWIADPAAGKRRLTHAEFEASWSGYSALFDYSEEVESEVGLTPAAAQPSSLWSALWPLIRQQRGSIALGAGLAGLASLLALLFPVLTQFVVDQVIVDRDVDLLALLLGSMAIALTLMLLAQLIQQYLLAFVALRVDSAALDLLTRRLLALPMRYFHSRRTGDIQRRLDGARQIRQFLVQHGIGGSLALLQLAAALALMALYSPLLAGVFALSTPLYAVLMWISRRWLRPLYAQIEQAHGLYASQQIDAIRGIEAVKAGAAELTFRDNMLRQFLQVSRQQFRGNFLVMAYDSALQAIGLISLLAFLWFGAQQVIAGSLSVGALIAFNSLLAMAAAAILRALGAWDELQYVSVLVNRLRDIFEAEPEQGTDRSRLQPVRSLEGRISLRQISFRYGGAQATPILNEISLDLAPGRSYALVGRSGCGKTTLVKLIAGLIEPSAGQLCFDHMDAAQLNHRDLRRQIGFVLQENHLFDASVLDNIAFGEHQPDLARATRAAQMAYADEFIQRLPLGYETRIGDSGLALSGGQRQRIAIARALYHDPPVLILDEATSALDSESERAIQGNLAQIARGRTCIVIAHRLSTIREADQIIVLDQGRVAEQGDHDQLLQRRGLYFYLHSQQLAL